MKTHIEIRPLMGLNSTDLERVGSGYSSDARYAVVCTELDHRISFDLQLAAIVEPFTKKYDHYDDETLQRYDRVLDHGYSFGAYDGSWLVGLVIAEPYSWNRSIWVREFHVTETHRNTGIGKRLMECVAEKAKRAGFRIIVCETQNTNATAIQVYRRLGFRVEGIDISYYSNTDYPDGEIAVFMKRRLE